MAPPTLLGDVLYNCSTTNYAEAGVGFKDTRGQSFSLSERVSIKLELGFLGLASSSAHAVSSASSRRRPKRR